MDLMDLKKKPLNDVESANSQYGGTDGAPPSYDDKESTAPFKIKLFDDIKEAKNSGDSVFKFLLKVGTLFASTIFCTIAVTALMFAIPIAMIVLGAKYKNDCPVEKYIPIYLIVGGSVGLFRNFISLCQQGRQRGSSGDENSPRSPLIGFIDCFALGWFIAGNVWIYSNYKPSFTPGDAHYCHKTLYLFAFWLTNTTYIMIGVSCFFLCCTACFAACLFTPR